MAYIRKKKIKNNSYYYIVQGKYDTKGRVKQKVIRYLGTIKNILEKFDFWDQQH
ncbi:MAG: hypothetical protein ABIF10_06180 [Candidatus Woesearchaeota archaeon]